MTLTHPDFATLFLVLTGEALPKDEARGALQHLDRCPSCRGVEREARLLLATVRGDRMSEPPRSVVERAISLWKKEHPGLMERALRVVKATLTFDSFREPLALGVRGGPSSLGRGKTGGAGSGRVRPLGGPRRLIYAAAGFDLDLEVSGRGTAGRDVARLSSGARARGARRSPRLSPREGATTGATIRGQVMAGPEEETLPRGSLVILEPVVVGRGVPHRRRGTTAPPQTKPARGSKAPLAARLDDHGVFSMPHVVPGRYRLMVEGKGIRLIADGLDVM